jgi:hypothetical protein
VYGEKPDALGLTSTGNGHSALRATSPASRGWYERRSYVLHRVVQVLKSFALKARGWRIVTPGDVCEQLRIHACQRLVTVLTSGPGHPA